MWQKPFKSIQDPSLAVWIRGGVVGENKQSAIKKKINVPMHSVNGAEATLPQLFFF